MANTITIRIRLEDGEPTALAKLCTRFGYEQAVALSDSPEERRAMESTILKIQAALHRKAAALKSARRLGWWWRHQRRDEPEGANDHADYEPVPNGMPASRTACGLAPQG
jgi:hypothetical protein